MNLKIIKDSKFDQLNNNYRWLEFKKETSNFNDIKRKFNRVIVFGKFSKSFIRTQLKGLYTISNFVNFISFADIYRKLDHKSFQDKILSLCVKYKADVVLIDLPLGGFCFDEETFERIRHINIKLFGLAYDNSSDNKFYIENYCKFDGVLCTSPLTRYEFDFVGIPSSLVWPLPQISLKKIDNLEKDIDVSFIGAIKANRLNWINKLKKRGIKISTYGYGSENGSLSIQEYYNVLIRSKITLNFNKPNNHKIYTILDKNYNWRTCPTLRNVEAALCNTLCISEWVPEIELMFDKNSIEYFSNEDELVSKIEYYLTNPKTRERRSALSREFALNNIYNEKRIAKSILSLCSKEAENFLNRGRAIRINFGYSKMYKFTRLIFFTKRLIKNIKNLHFKEIIFNFKIIFKDLISLNVLFIFFLFLIIFEKRQDN